MERIIFDHLSKENLSQSYLLWNFIQCEKKKTFEVINLFFDKWEFMSIESYYCHIVKDNKIVLMMNINERLSIEINDEYFLSYNNLFMIEKNKNSDLQYIWYSNGKPKVIAQTRNFKLHGFYIVFNSYEPFDDDLCIFDHRTEIEAELEKDFIYDNVSVKLFVNGQKVVFKPRREKLIEQIRKVYNDPRNYRIDSYECIEY